ncbi:MAG: translation initiation factor IF-2, partial [Lachnospiraceae bacterium]|nr:translation initiation factor IF-2 [Lachnospiraceae bacterium]
QGERPFNRDGQRPQGERPFNRDGQQRPQGERPFNRDGQQRPQGERPFNRDGQRPQGERPFNRDGQRPQGERPFNRDGQRPQGERPFNRDGQRPQGERPFNRDGQRPQGDRSFNVFNKDKDKDKDAAPQGRPQGGRSGDRNGARAARPVAGEALPMGKPSAKQVQKPVKNNTRQDRKRNEKQEAEEMFLKKGQKPGNRPAKPAPVAEEIKTIVLPDTLTIKDLADLMKMQPSAIVKKLFMAGKIVTINQEIDYETAEEIAMEYDILCEHEVKVDVLEELLKDIEDDEAKMEKRPPVVCVMGHVDHGKTSLLDAIRSTRVTDKEAGGITQHIGAYMVECNGEPITFLDTPGHEAFTAMRMRGAKSTDIAILVVAADDGVMPQTVEAISHAKAADVEIIVAINKIDKPSANIERVKQELTEHGLIAEDWGGSTIFVPVSAKTGEGIDTLLEMVLLAAEVKELKADAKRLARGLIIEAQLDKGKGPVATVLVQKGTLHVGDNIAVGSCYGKVRAMMDDKGRRVKEATPSTPVEILGLNAVPSAGDTFVATVNEKEARNFAETFISEGRERMLEETKQKMSLDDLFSQIQAGNLKELNLIVKADVQGSVEAVKQSLMKLSNEEVVVKIIHGGVGAINESDVTLAATSSAIIIGFNVRPDATAKSIAEREKVDLRLYKVIYQAIEDIEAAMKGMLDPVFEEKIIGHAIVRQLFKASGVGTIAGSFITDGKFQRGCKVRITRGGDQIFEGDLASLKRFKDDVKEVAKGYECGLVFDGFNDLMEDDMIEAYIMVEVPR